MVSCDSNFWFFRIFASLSYYNPISNFRYVFTCAIFMITVPPDPPEIQGYIEGETIRMGQTLSLTCVSYGGNPLATITWFRNGEMVDMSYTTSGRESRNMYTFVAQSEDNGARFSCEAKNEMSTETMKAEILLAVQCEYTISKPKLSL